MISPKNLDTPQKQEKNTSTMKPKKGKNNHPSQAKKPDAPPSGQSIYYLSQKIRKTPTSAQAIPLNKGNRLPADTATAIPAPGAIEKAVFNTSPESNTPATAKKTGANSIIQSIQNNAPAYFNDTEKGAKDNGSVLSRVFGPAGKMMDVSGGDSAQPKTQASVPLKKKQPVTGGNRFNNPRYLQNNAQPVSPAGNNVSLNVGNFKVESESKDEGDFLSRFKAAIDEIAGSELKAAAGLKK